MIANSEQRRTNSEVINYFPDSFSKHICVMHLSLVTLMNQPTCLNDLYIVGSPFLVVFIILLIDSFRKQSFPSPRTPIAIIDTISFTDLLYSPIKFSTYLVRFNPKLKMGYFA